MYSALILSACHVNNLVQVVFDTQCYRTACRNRLAVGSSSLPDVVAAFTALMDVARVSHGPLSSKLEMVCRSIQLLLCRKRSKVAGPVIVG